MLLKSCVMSPEESRRHDRSLKFYYDTAPFITVDITEKMKEEDNLFLFFASLAYRTTIQAIARKGDHGISERALYHDTVLLGLQRGATQN